MGSWGEVAALATAVSVTTTLFLSLIWRMLDGRAAAWMPFGGDSYWRRGSAVYGGSTPPRAFCDLANTGDGDAFSVRVLGLGCAAELRGEWVAQRGRSRLVLVPKLASGEVVRAEFECDTEIWDRATVAIIWTASPTRLPWLTRRVHYIPLSRIADAPLLEEGDDDDAKVRDPREPDMPLRPRRWQIAQRIQFGRRLRNF